MKYFTISAVVITSVTFYIGVYHLLIYFRRKGHREDLTFSLTCLTVGIYGVFCAGLYSSSSFTEGVRWQHGQFILLPLAAMMFLRFIFDYTKQKSGWIANTFSILLVLSAIVNAVNPAKLILQVDNPFVKKISLSSGIMVTYYEAEPGQLLYLEWIIAVLVFIYILRLCIRFYKSEEIRKAISLIVAVAILFGSIINDFMVMSGIYQFIRVFEYAYLGVMIFMAYSLSGELMRAGEIEEELEFKGELVDSALSVITAVDLDGNVTYVNPAFLRTWDFDNPKEVLGKNITNFWVVEDRFEKVIETLKERGRWSDEIKARKKDGTKFDIQTSVSLVYNKYGDPVSLISSSVDITERKRAENYLITARKAMDSATDAIVIYTPEGRHFYQNEAFIHLFGYSDRELARKSSWRFVFKDKKSADGILAKISGGSSWVGELEMVKKGGDILPVLLKVNPIKTEGEENVGFIGVYTDITERKIEENRMIKYSEYLEDLVQEWTKEFEKAQEEIMRQEKLATLGKLTATVSHEIRNPLGTVRTSFFSIKDGIKKDDRERVKRALELAERNIIRCDRIIEDLLDFTRIKESHLVPTDIDRWLGELIDEQEIPDGIVCKRELNAGIEVSIDQENLRRAVINVVNNAVQALDDKDAAGDHFTVLTKVSGDWVEIKVVDAGPGISDEFLGRIFEPLFSGKSFGVGMGLAIVKSIIEQHNGSVEIESKIGRGTTVILYLPLKQTKGHKA